jgi:colicin import membrane protein
MAALAGTGEPSSTGTAARTAGPSATYGGRIKAAIKPNIVFTDSVDGNPMAVVEVRAAPDGTIIGQRLVKSSGVKSWDDAVMRAIDKTAVLPRDTDGRVPSPFEISFRVHDQ